MGEGSMQPSNVKPVAKEGRYFTFALGSEEYGLEIKQVSEIIGLMEITFVPQVPPYVKGVINLRGKIIPAIDIRLKFGMEHVPYTPETCIIVLNIKNVLIGIIVDRVCEVIDILQKDIEQTPSLGLAMNSGFIMGMAKVGDKVKVLLDIEKILVEDAASIGSM
jgi:purine-binding chemotaxis protein CheW